MMLLWRAGPSGMPHSTSTRHRGVELIRAQSRASERTLTRWPMSQPLVAHMRLSLASKILGAILVASTLLLVSLWYRGFSQLAILGPTYQQIVNSKDLVADILPPPQLIIEPFLDATVALRSPEQAERLWQRALTLKASYDERHTHWLQSSINPDVKDLLVEKAHRPAQEFWVTLDRNFYPALIRRDAAAANKAHDQLELNYRAHRAAMDDVVTHANRLVLSAERDGKILLSLVLRSIVMSSIVVLGVVGACIVAVNARFSRPIDQLRGVMQRLAQNDLTADVPFVDRQNEVGDLARAVCVFREVQIRKAELADINAGLERKIKQRSAELEQTLENMTQGIVLMRDDDMIIANSKAVSLLELTDPTELPVRIAAFGENFDRDESVNERRNLPAGQTRTDVTCPSGRIVEVRRSRHGFVGDVFTFSDVTTLKRRQADLEKAVAAAKSAVDARSRFFSTMSHEMRTPLNGVIGALELMRTSKLDDEQHELVHVALQSSDALLVHINDVLDFSKMEAGKFEVNPVPMDMKAVVKSVLDVMAPHANHSNNKLRSDFGEGLPRWIMGDPVRIRQVILNFVSNALKFTRNGDVTVRVQRVGGITVRPEIEVAVIDTGLGIAKNRLGSLFKEFTMLHTPTKDTTGSGLGLSISQRLVDAMGGSVGVESQEGTGSTFWFRVVFEATDIAPACDIVSGLALTRSVRPLSILLVDDNRTNRLVGTKLLAGSGHRVATAKHGREAVEMATDTRYDLVFMDISMPDMDGIEATAHIRRLPEPFCSVPIVALTANAIAGDRERFLASGMDDYISKPLKRAQIETCLAVISRKFNGTAIAAPVADETVAAAAFQFPILNAAELDELASDAGPDIIAEILSTYLEELDRRLVELDEAVSTANVMSVKAVAHAIAGASASTGAMRLMMAARAVEMACIESNLPDALSNIAALKVTASDTITHCKQKLSNQIPQAA